MPDVRHESLELGLEEWTYSCVGTSPSGFAMRGLVNYRRVLPNGLEFNIKTYCLYAAKEACRKWEEGEKCQTVSHSDQT